MKNKLGLVLIMLTAMMSAYSQGPEDELDIIHM